MSEPTLHGPGFSTCVRSCRIVLAGNSAGRTLNKFNVYAGLAGRSPEAAPVQDAAVPGLTRREAIAALSVRGER